MLFGCFCGLQAIVWLRLVMLLVVGFGGFICYLRLRIGLLVAWILLRCCDWVGVGLAIGIAGVRLGKMTWFGLGCVPGFFV